MNQDEAQKPERISRRGFLFGAVAGAGAAAAGVSLLTGPGRIQVTRHNIALRHFPQGARPLRIVQLSDLHRNSWTGEDHIRQCAHMCNAPAPDLVVITGDFIGSVADSMDPAAAAKSCARALSVLRAGLGVFAVPGNHDHWEGLHHVRAAFGGRVRFLINENYRIAEDVYLVGIDDAVAGSPDIGRAFKGVPARAAQLVITHSPAIFPELAGRHAFVMAGHTHGGQVNLPVATDLLIRHLPGWKYARGLHTQGNAAMYVNRGIGRGALPRFRCRPEISVFECSGAA